MDEQLDILISRVIDGVASAADWRALEAEAVRDPSVWHELAMAQREHQLLGRAVVQAVCIADQIELPAQSVLRREHNSLAGRTRLAAAWGGWAAAAAIGLAFVTQSPGPSDGNQANLGAPVLTAAEALKQYKSIGQKDGRFIGEVPGKVLVDTVPSEDGNGYKVFYLRQFLECERVPNLHTLSTDELGQPTKVPVNLNVRTKPAL